MKIKNILSLVLLLIISGNVLAQQIFHKTKIDMIYPFSDGKVYVGIDTENEACKNTNEFYRLAIGEAGVTEEAMGKIYSAMLAAAAQQNQVEIIFEPKADGHCYISRLKIFY